MAIRKENKEDGVFFLGMQTVDGGHLIVENVFAVKDTFFRRYVSLNTAINRGMEVSMQSTANLPNNGGEAILSLGDVYVTKGVMHVCITSLVDRQHTLTKNRHFSYVNMSYHFMSHYTNKLLFVIKRNSPDTFDRHKSITVSNISISLFVNTRKTAMFFKRL